MRYAVLADVHGNLPALETALAFCRRLGVDGYLCAGDLVGYGPFPNECVERVAELGMICVAGNHDLIVQGRLTTERCIPLARQSLEWTAGVLREDVRRFLAGLPLRAEVDGKVVMAHGSLEDPQEYVRERGQAERELRRLAERWPEARVLLLGHTHQPWVFPGEGGRVLLNPGSVGQSRDWFPRVRLAVLEVETGRVTQHSLGYPEGVCRAELERVGLSGRCCHLRPSVLGLGKRAARRVGKLVAAGLGRGAYQ